MPFAKRILLTTLLLATACGSHSLTVVDEQEIADLLDELVAQTTSLQSIAFTYRTNTEIEEKYYTKVKSGSIAMAALPGATKRGTGSMKTNWGGEKTDVLYGTKIRARQDGWEHDGWAIGLCSHLMHDVFLDCRNFRASHRFCRAAPTGWIRVNGRRGERY